jgi:tetratricopeptide (TPR) repeat protein
LRKLKRATGGLRDRRGRSSRARYPGLLRSTGTLLAGLAVAAAAATQAAAAAPTALVDPIGKGSLKSPLGHYLAGRFAIDKHRLGDAANLMLFTLSHDPENVDLLRRCHALLASEGRFDEALPLAETLNRLAPDNSGSNLTLVLHGARVDDWAAASAALQGLPREGLNRIYLPIAGAWAQLGQGNADAAIDMLELLDGVGVDPLQRVHEGLIYEVAGRTAEAAKAYEAALQAAKSPSLRMAAIVGNFYERTGRTDAARKLYQDYGAANPDTYLLDDGIGRLDAGKAPMPLISTPLEGLAEGLFNIAGLLSQGDTENLALTYARAAVYLKPDFVLGKILIGELLQGQGRSEDAIAIYREIPADSKFSWAARQRIADELDKLGKIDEAMAVLESLAAERPDSPGPLVRIGNMLRHAERFKEAADAYDRAIARLPEIDSRYWSLFYFRGIALERTGHWDRAEADFLRALELEPDQPQVMNYLAYSWVEQVHNLAKAEKMLARAVELRPNDGYIVDSFGWALYRLNRYQQAVGYLERAAELSPQDPVINDHLGDAYWRVGRRAEARFQWRRALSFGPDKDEINKIERKLDRGLELSDSGNDI